MNNLPKALLAWLTLGSFLTFPSFVSAATIASQTDKFEDILKTSQVLQELGSNLSGKASSFTFRVSSTKPNLDQFDNTASNSRIYDKTTNTYISGCVSANDTSHSFLKGLTFTTTNVPSGYQDVTIDFSCNNYTFIPGNKYLIKITNANLFSTYAGIILFGAASYNSTSDDYFIDGGLRYPNGNKFDFSNNGGSCDPIKYKWSDLTKNPKSGCNIWTSSKDDIYFILKNNEPDSTPTPSLVKTPVIFIPGIGGSELKAEQDIIWSKDNGHGGTYTNLYPAGEKVWINQDEAAKLGDDDYFDVLRLKDDGVTSEANLTLTGKLTPFGYEQIEPFFEELGYSKNIDFFIFPYDWRKDIRATKDKLDNLIETAKTTSGRSKVDIVAHSMGGLVARYYISDSEKAGKVDKLIGLGVPHLGSVDSLKTIRFGSWLGYDFKIITLGIPPSETKDGAQNMTSMFQLLPSNKYYDFYKNTDSNLLYPLEDVRDIDNNQITGSLNFSQLKILLTNLSHNMTIFNFGEQLHDTLDSSLNKPNGVKIYLITGSGQPTLGQIKETWWITWPIKFIPKTEEIMINGDETVPLYSASLKNEAQDISGAEKIYYVEQTHGGLISKEGPAMQTVKTILNQQDQPTEVKSEKISLEGQQISLDDGEIELYDQSGNHTGLKNNNEEIETNIPGTFYSMIGTTKQAFIKKKAGNIKVVVTRKNKTTSTPKTTNLKIRNYEKDAISKTIIYKDLSLTETGKIEVTLNPSSSITPNLQLFVDSTKEENITITATSEISGIASSDQTPPITKIESSGTNPVTITLTSSDTDSGILKTEYSLDNGETVQIYTNPFTISSSGKSTLQVKSIDKAGNEELPQSIDIEINSSTSNSSSTNSSENTSSQTTSEINSTKQDNPKISTEQNPDNSFLDNEPSSETSNTDSTQTSILGANTQNSAEITTAKISIFNHPSLGGLLVVAMGLQGMLPILSSVFTFFKPTPK